MNIDLFAAKEKFIDNMEGQFHEKVKNFTSGTSKQVMLKQQHTDCHVCWVFFNCSENLMFSINIRTKPHISALKEKIIVDLEARFNDTDIFF